MRELSVRIFRFLSWQKSNTMLILMLYRFLKAWTTEDRSQVTVKKRKISTKMCVFVRKFCHYARNDVGMSRIMIFGKLLRKFFGFFFTHNKSLTSALWLSFWLWFEYLRIIMIRIITRTLTNSLFVQGYAARGRQSGNPLIFKIHSMCQRNLRTPCTITNPKNECSGNHAKYEINYSKT